jgi:DNA-binding MarR family transcriptional regulator
MSQDRASIEQIQEMRNLSIGRLLLRASRDFHARSQQKLLARGYDLTPAHTAVLVHLDIKGTRINTRAERAGMTKQAMSQLVQELEAQGYVTRTSDPGDGRAVAISFTDTGMQFLQDAYTIKQEIESEYTALLGEAGFAALVESLRTLLTSSAGDVVE